jgi:uncharacterized protein with HEPN domain
MSQHNTKVSLQHMLDHALEAIAMVKGKTRADLDKDRRLNLALVRLLEPKLSDSPYLTREAEMPQTF